MKADLPFDDRGIDAGEMDALPEVRPSDIYREHADQVLSDISRNLGMPKEVAEASDQSRGHQDG